jgi:hypothetical protein
MTDAKRFCHGVTNTLSRTKVLVRLGDLVPLWRNGVSNSSSKHRDVSVPQWRFVR